MKFILHSALALSLVLACPLRAQDEDQPERDYAAERAEKVEAIKEKMKYFESHVGEWTGEERYHVLPTDVESETKDEWKGFFSLDGTHFEMHGKGVSEEGPTTYKWICTYDAAGEVYRAWYFDSSGNKDQYEMDWDDDKKVLVWTSEDEELGTVSTFFMRVKGNEITGEGETSAAGSGAPLIKHTMTYKKKKLKV